MNELAKMSSQRLQESLNNIIVLLDKHKLVTTMVKSQREPHHDLVESLVRRQQLTELHVKLKKLHTADIAYILESVPHDDRILIWQQISPARRGEILLDISDSARPSLIESMSSQEQHDALKELATDDLNLIAGDLRQDVLEGLRATLTNEERHWMDTTLRYEHGQIGRIMSHEMVAIQQNITIQQATEKLRNLQDFPIHLDKLFVTDDRKILKGVLPLRSLLRGNPDTPVSEVMATDVVSFIPEDEADHAGLAFERYDLVSAPVTSERGRLLGRLTVDVIMDHIREESSDDTLNMVGLQDDEDLFSPIIDSARNRWMWLGINLFTAFIASQVISLFEVTISKLIALAVLMPIVASIGGNSGNQTTALVIRAMALDQIKAENHIHLLLKEINIALLNGLVWGSVVGVFAFFLYSDTMLSAVISVAMLINFLIAAIAGVAIPLTLERIGRDPALGSSILLTAMVDSMGFFIFLGLASVVLV